MSTSIRRALTMFWLPALLISLHVGVRAFGGRPMTDLDGTSAVLRIAVLAFGASIAYFMTLLPQWAQRPGDAFWRLVALWFCAMLIDDSFMVHETLGKRFGIQDSVPLVGLGLLLLALLWPNRHRMQQSFWMGFAGFAGLSVIAVAGDIISGREGVVQVAGFGFDYEQTAELLGTFCLAAGFASQALGEVVVMLAPSVPNRGPLPSQDSVWRRVVQSLRRTVRVPGPSMPDLNASASNSGDGSRDDHLDASRDPHALDVNEPHEHV